ncbi:hypothetical protein [Ruminococcus albus]|nr:hypothetical protein [Ruminococcus albus]
MKIIAQKTLTIYVNSSYFHSPMFTTTLIKYLSVSHVEVLS